MTTKVDRNIKINIVGALTIDLPIPEGLTILEDPKETAPKHHGCIRVPTPKDGDKRIIWDNRSYEQICQAKDTFDRLVQEGLIPYRVGTGGKATSEIMVEFDPHAEEIVLIPIQLAVGG